jgi:hypothetical protein
MLDKDQGFGIVNRWNDFSKDRVKIGVVTQPIVRLLDIVNRIVSTRPKQ